QGKWYPGEPLPRWALNCYWRRDGVPVWRDAGLFADDNTCTNPDETLARRFTRRVAERLGVDPGHACPGYEDVWYYLWKERRLPVNVDPLKSRLENELERERLARIFEEGLGSVVGYALPLDRRWINGQPTWVSGRWFFRPEHMF